MVNVKDVPYAAKGDGKTDDTAAIQKAIDAVATKGGGIVDIPNACTTLSVPMDIFDFDIRPEADVVKGHGSLCFRDKVGFGNGRGKLSILKFGLFGYSNGSVYM